VGLYWVLLPFINAHALYRLSMPNKWNFAFDYAYFVVAFAVVAIACTTSASLLSTLWLALVWHCAHPVVVNDLFSLPPELLVHVLAAEEEDLILDSIIILVIKQQQQENLAHA
jgi:hypothetical protein